MNVTRVIWHDSGSERTKLARHRVSDGLLGMALLVMLCAAQVLWLLPGVSGAASIVAAAEGFQSAELTD